MYNQFISWQNPTAFTAANIQVIEDMLKFVRWAFVNRDTDAAVKYAVAHFEVIAKAAMFDKIAAPFKNEKTLNKIRNAQVPEKSTEQFVFDAIEDCMSFALRKDSMRLAYIDFTDAKFSESFNKKFNTLGARGFSETPSLQSAFETSLSNLSRATTRVVFVNAIMSLLNLSSDQKSAVALLKFFYDQIESFQVNTLIFATLCGQEEQKKAMRIIAPSVCVQGNSNISWSLMQFISADGVSPRSYFTAEYEKLQREIEDAYRKFVG